MRSYRELWLWLGGLLLTAASLLAAIGIAYFAKEAHYSLYKSAWMRESLLSFLLAFGCFLAAIIGWRFPPWLAIKFPDIKVDICGAESMAIKHSEFPGFERPCDLRAMKVRITSREIDQNASLTVRVFLKLVPGSFGRVGEKICTPPHGALSPSLPLNPIAMPFPLLPNTTVSGDIVYEIPMLHVGTLGEPIQRRLEIEDHISEKRMSILLSGDLARFNTSDMSPSRGGVEILGPEYDTRTSEKDGTNTAPTSP